ncbi:hypothetical protein K438DRAFT_1770955 [Mycena galopus ATCC 62051]|nr:hypothetical protein K438DRAFT_1770955 [Mycena galopus ATCC 62051]
MSTYGLPHKPYLMAHRSNTRAPLTFQLGGSIMYNFVGVFVLAAFQLGLFFAMATDASDPVSPASSFFASLITLQNAAVIFSGDSYSGAFPPNLPELDAIAAHLKNCSDAFDAAVVQLASIPQLSPPDAAIPNSTNILFSQQAILDNLNELQATKATFEAIINDPFVLLTFCNSVKDLSHQNDAFFGRLTLIAPSSDYAAFWFQVQENAAVQYHIWLTLRSVA